MINPPRTLDSDGPGHYIQVGSYRFYPVVTWSDLPSPFGCFSRTIAYFSMSLGMTVHAETGAPFFEEPYVIGQNLTREQDEFLNLMGLYVVPSISGLALSPGIFHHEFCRDLFRTAMNNSWNTFITLFGGAGLVMWGDAIQKAGYWTKYMAWYLKTQGLGTISSTHGAANPNYPGILKICRVWAWTPPKYADLTVPAGEIFGVQTRTREDISKGMRKIWKVAPSTPEFDPVIELFRENGELSAKTAV